MRASYYAIREWVPRNSKGAKAQGISLSNMTGHGRPTHPFFVQIRATRTTLLHRLLISKTFSRFSSAWIIELIVKISEYFGNSGIFTRNYTIVFDTIIFIY